MHSSECKNYVKCTHQLFFGDKVKMARKPGKENLVGCTGEGKKEKEFEFGSEVTFHQHDDDPWK